MKQKTFFIVSEGLSFDEKKKKKIWQKIADTSFKGMNLIPRATFLTHSNWSTFFSCQSLCIMKEALGTSFQTQQEQTVFIQ